MSRQQQPFPDAATVTAFAAKSPPALPSPDVRYVDAWTLAGPSGAKEGEAYGDASPWGGLVAETVTSNQTVASNALRCAANEMALFALANQGLPAIPLRRHALGRCGAPTTSSIATIRGDVPASTPDDQIFPKLAPRVRETFAKVPKGALVGLAVVRKGDRLVAAMAYGKPSSIDASSSTIAADHSATVRGVAPDASLKLHGYVNQGAFGTAKCTALPETPPRFALRCPIAPDEHGAWIEVMGAKPGAYVGQTIANVYAHDDDASTLLWTSAAIKKAKPATNASEATNAMLADLNAIRLHEGAVPLVLVPAQSATNAAIFPHLMAAEMSGDPAWESLTLAVLAGWDVHDATIASANVSAASFGTAPDGSSALEAMLALPGGRVALLAKSARRVAIGAVVNGSSVGGLVTAYSTFEGDDHRAEVAFVERRIAETRAAKGLDGGALIDNLGLVDDGKEPTAALDSALKRAVEKTHRSMRGTVHVVSDLDLVSVPEPLLAKPNTPFAVQVMHRREKGAAWGQWVVMILWAD